jgi:hypothetical protein
MAKMTCPSAFQNHTFEPAYKENVIGVTQMISRRLLLEKQEGE